jgi:hypothetical protein
VLADATTNDLVEEIESLAAEEVGLHLRHAHNLDVLHIGGSATYRASDLDPLAALADEIYDLLRGPLRL